MAHGASNNSKMKGLFRGLRYISQIFDDNKGGQEMQIGFPTDVKHVAHIGWDGPSTASSPSWMNEFEGPPGLASAPISPNGEIIDDHAIKWVSEDTNRKGFRGILSPARDSPELPRSSRRQSSSSGGGGISSPRKEKSDKPKQTRRSSKHRDSSDGSTRGPRLLTSDSREGSTRGARQQATDISPGSESPHNLPDVPKKTRRKKSRETSGGGSLRRSKDCGTPSKCNSNELPQNSFLEVEGKSFM